MLTFILHSLLVVGSIHVAMATAGPETQSNGNLRLAQPPPTSPSQPVDAAERNLYCQTLLQSDEPVSPDQIPWFCLCTACQDTPGPKGSSGDRGLPGSPGSPGRRGMTGFRGPPGFMGRPGVKGQKGDNGEKGDRGYQGQAGPKGGRGFKGEKGEQGLEGRLGDQGPKGNDGVCPETCESSQGSPGPTGMPGPAGSRGLPGIMGASGPKGVKGDLGDLGRPGAPGPVGEKGEPGPLGECNCTGGAVGGPGQKGDKGEQGGEGPMGPAGLTGPQGDKGDMGGVGMMGPPGPCMPSVQSAFSAGLTSSLPPPRTPVVFSHIIYNTQGHYNPSTGLYTAPANGTYVLSYHLTVHDRVLKVGLFHNFRPVVKTTESGTLATTSQSVVLHLARGDRVWILVKDSATNGMYAAPEARSTFSGFLLHPDTCDVALPRGPALPLSVPDEGYSWGDDL